MERGRCDDCFGLLGLPRRFALPRRQILQSALPLLRFTHPDQPCGDCQRYALVQSAVRTVEDPVLRAEHLCRLQCAERAPGPRLLEREVRLGQRCQGLAPGRQEAVYKRETRRALAQFERSWRGGDFEGAAQLVQYLKFLRGQRELLRGQQR